VGSGEEDMEGIRLRGGVGMLDLLVEGGDIRLREEVALEVVIVEGTGDLQGMEEGEVILIDRGVGVLIGGGVGVEVRIEVGDEGALVTLVMIAGVLRLEAGVGAGAEVLVGAGVCLEGETGV